LKVNNLNLFDFKPLKKYFTYFFISGFDILPPEGGITFEGGAAFVVEAYPIYLQSMANTTLTKDMLGKFLTELKEATVEQYSNNKTSGFKLLESNMTTLDGDIASKLVYVEKTDPKVEMNFTELFSIRVNSSNYNPYVTYYTGYGIIFFTNVNAYNHYEPTFQKMIDSIKLKGRND
jgi:hypothetical protein